MKKRFQKIANILKKLYRGRVSEEPAEDCENGCPDGRKEVSPLLVGFLTGVALRLIFELLGLIG